MPEGVATASEHLTSAIPTSSSELFSANLILLSNWENCDIDTSSQEAVLIAQ
jgi:hypothetical protein